MAKKNNQPSLDWSISAGGGVAMFSDVVEAANHCLNWVRDNYDDAVTVSGPEDVEYSGARAIRWAQDIIDNAPVNPQPNDSELSLDPDAGFDVDADVEPENE